MRNFTFILECGGGTYVDQAEGIEHLDATKNWLAKIVETKPIPDINDIVVHAFETNLKEFAPVALIGLKSVWYFEFDIKNIHAWGHIVESHH